MTTVPPLADPATPPTCGSITFDRADPLVERLNDTEPVDQLGHRGQSRHLTRSQRTRACRSGRPAARGVMPTAAGQLRCPAVWQMPTGRGVGSDGQRLDGQAPGVSGPEGQRS
jgi:hypothetical protein